MKYNIRLIASIIVFLCIGIADVSAQSMTDEQVLQFVAVEYQKGTSQAQIVTKLMQKGVDINQISPVNRLLTIVCAKTTDRLRNCHRDKCKRIS